MGGAGGISTQPMLSWAVHSQWAPETQSHLAWPDPSRDTPGVQASLGTLLLTRHYSSTFLLPWLWDSTFLGLTPASPWALLWVTPPCPKSQALRLETELLWLGLLRAPPKTQPRGQPPCSLDHPTPHPGRKNWALQAPCSNARLVSTGGRVGLGLSL